MRRIISTLALAAFIAAPALAQGDLSADVSLARNDRMVRSVFLADLKAIVADAGHTIDSVGDAGENSVTGITPDGLIYHVDGTICENQIRPGCLGININIRYDGDEMVTYEKLNAANLAWNPVSVALDGVVGQTGSSLVITRYVILDGGMRMENIKDNLTNALSIAMDVADFVWEVGDYAPDYEGDYDDW